MTPLPKPKPKLRPLNPKLHVPVTATQKALLANRKRRRKPMAMPTQEEINKFFEDQAKRYDGKKEDGDEKE